MAMCLGNSLQTTLEFWGSFRPPVLILLWPWGKLGLILVHHMLSVVAVSVNLLQCIAADRLCATHTRAGFAFTVKIYA